MALTGLAILELILAGQRFVTSCPQMFKAPINALVADYRLQRGGRTDVVFTLSSFCTSCRVRESGQQWTTIRVTMALPSHKFSDYDKTNY
jgi:hypothetical protein